MDLGNKLLELRKKKNLSQEEAAFELNVTRQTISKWETNQSVPDFSKLVALCELYEITPNDLLLEKDITFKENSTIEDNSKGKKAKMIGVGILLYFVACVLVLISIPVMKFNPVISVSIFLLICGIGTYMIIVACITYSKKEVNTKEIKLRKEISSIIAIMTTVIYLLVSFITGAWHITWIIWLLYAILEEIIKLIFILKGDNYEE